MDFHQEVRQLLHLTQAYLFQNHPLQERLISSPSTTEFYRDYARHLKKQTPSPPVPAAGIPQKTLPVSLPLPPVKRDQEGTQQKKEEAPKRAPPKQEEPSHQLPENDVTTPLSPSSPMGIRAFQFKPAAAISLPDFASLKTFISQHVPRFPWIEAPPSDAEGQQLARQWKHPLLLEVILICDERAPDHHRQFLQNLVKALEAKGKKGTVILLQKIEKMQKWPALFSMNSLKLMVIPSPLLSKIPAAKEHWKPSSFHGFLNGIATVLVDIEKDTADPVRKKQLWQVIREILKF